MRLLAACLLLVLVVSSCTVDRGAKAEEKIEFWSDQRKGANFFNRSPTRARFEAASQLGLEFVRLAPDKWRAQDRDFLIGDADHYEGINEKDFEKLEEVLGYADQTGIRVVLTMLSLPGTRWKQNNGGQDDPRLWRDARYQNQAMQFWQDLARRLGGHPAVVAYDPLNEPHPARALLDIDDPESTAFEEWFAASIGTEADLNDFNHRIVSAIREVDPTTPIVLEGYSYASVNGFKFMEPVDDQAILYSFHFYEPWNYTTKRVNNGRFAYPDRMPTGWSGEVERWTPERLSHLIRPVVTWSERHAIPANRILVGEFGCNREVAGAKRYLEDLIKIFNRQQWHWAFYAYREDTWTGMDYELSSGKLGFQYWQAVEAGEQPELPRQDNPLFDVIKREFQ